MRAKRFIALATQAAKLSDCKKKVGAIIAKGNRIIGIGHNKIKSHPKQINRYTGKAGRAVCAELSAIINSRGNLSKCTICIVRITKDGKLAMAKPCQYCQSYIEEAGIKNIIYTNSNGEIRKEKVY
jgi:deoxycytidylate deaminase